jgi:hypothetical protein
VLFTAMTQVTSDDPQLLNIIFNKAMNASDFQRIGRGHYSKTEQNLATFPRAKDWLQIFPGIRSEVLAMMLSGPKNIFTCVNIDPISKVISRGKLNDRNIILIHFHTYASHWLIILSWY